MNLALGKFAYYDILLGFQKKRSTEKMSVWNESRAKYRGKGRHAPTVQRMQAMILVFCDLDTLKGPELMKA